MSPKMISLLSPRFAFLALLALSLASLLTPPHAVAAPTALERVEPPSWWVGMRQPRLQLMLYGQNIGRLKPALRHPGVRLLGSTRTDNPNYLFVDLEIAPGARSGELLLRLLDDGDRTVLSHRYPLLTRSPGSAQRQGFDSRDAIYLLVPDRFANGNTANDHDPALGDRLDRQDPGARHGGDIQGIVDRLDYIAGMGFTQIWPTPMLENRQPEYSYHGYSPTDLYRIDPRLGSNEDYRHLVAAARARGIGFIQDIVPNHIGSGHWWMKDLPARDWVHPAQPYVETNHRHGTVQDPYAAQADIRGFTQGWFVPTMPDLNQRQPLLATYLTQNAIWWIEYAGLSGLRVDTYPYSDKEFLARWTRAIRHEYPRLGLVGEEMHDNPLMVAYWLDGHRNRDGYKGPMPSMMDFPLHWRLRDALLEPEGAGYGSGLGKLYEAMLNDLLYPQPERMVLFEGNHDTNRIFSAMGEDLALTRMAVAVIATTRRTPQFFYGSELLMTSPLQRDDGRVRAGFPGGWHGDAADAVSGRGLSAPQLEFQQFMRRLLQWRKTASAVHQGRLFHFNPLGGVYAYFRVDARQTVMVVINKSAQPQPLDLPRYAELLKPGSAALDVISGAVHRLDEQYRVPPRSVQVLELKR